MYESDGGAWWTEGDGKILVNAFDGKSVAITFQNVGQFAQAVGLDDIFIVTGAVTVPSSPSPRRRVAPRGCPSRPSARSRSPRSR